jgi:hypothetical protein
MERETEWFNPEWFFVFWNKFQNGRNGRSPHHLFHFWAGK